MNGPHVNASGFYVDAEYASLVFNCSEQGKALMRQLANAGRPETLYLFFRPSVPGKPGALFLARDSAPNPMGYELATGEGLRISLPYDDYYAWIWSRARHCRILSMDKETEAQTVTN